MLQSSLPDMSNTIETYSFVLADGKHIPFKKALLQYFKTMENMVISMGYNLDPLPALLPLPLPESITKPVIEYCILMASGQEANRLRVDNIDIPFLVSVCKALNYLDAEIIMKACLDRIYFLFNRISITDIECLFAVPNEVWPPLTPHYKRIEAIHGFLSQVLPIEILRPKYDLQPRIRTISASLTHSLEITSLTTLTGGSARCEELGLPYESGYHQFKSVVPPSGNILLVSCGWTFSFCLTTTGLYACGSNLYGQLALGNTQIAYKTEWTQIEIEGEVLQIEAYGNHIIVLTTIGLYGAGQNDCGQLGLIDLDNYYLLTPIKVYGDVIAIASDRTYSIVFTSTGLYGCGYSKQDEVQRAVIMTRSGVYSSGYDSGIGLELIPGFTGTIDSITCSVWKKIIFCSPPLRECYCFKT